MHWNHFQSVLFIRKTRNSFYYYWKSSTTYIDWKEIFQIIVDFWGSTLAEEDRFGEFTRSKLHMKEYFVLYEGISDKVFSEFGQFFSTEISLHLIIIFLMLEGREKSEPAPPLGRSARSDWPSQQSASKAWDRLQALCWRWWSEYFILYDDDDDLTSKYLYVWSHAVESAF